MANPDELRAALAEARKALREAIEAAADSWEKQPASGEGEEAWSPRQVAQHVIPLEARMTTIICEACGYPGVDEVKGDYPTAADAVAALDEVNAMNDKKLKYVTEKDLAMTHDRLGTVESIMERFLINHEKEHAQQIRAAAGV